MPDTGQIRNRCYWVAQVTACDSAEIVYHEEVLKCTALPRSLTMQVEMFDGIEEFASDEDVAVLFLHFI